jgi:hypothetical protein
VKSKPMANPCRATGDCVTLAGRATQGDGTG